MTFRKLVLFTVITLVISAGCSTTKNTRVNRSYHNLNAHFNAYFNGKEAFKAGTKKVESANKDNFERILPVVLYSDPNNVSSAFPDMEKAISKASKVIKFHSITAKPKRKKGKLSKRQKEFQAKPEYNKWVDNAYLLMGKSHFYKHDFFQASQNFQYIISVYSKEIISYEATLWLIRTYNEEGKFSDSESLLDQLEGDRKFPKKFNGELNAIYADFHLKQRHYEEAIPRLRKAIDLKGNRKDKIRYRFILAQIYQKYKEYNKASVLYAEVIKMNPPYEMAFNAKINRAEAYSSGSGDVREIKKQLLKMLKDDKNIDYHDQIYFSLANIEQKEGNLKQAIEYYFLSARSSISNTNQQAISYLALADIYFSIPDYPKAQQFYDSTMTFLSSDYPEYEKISEKTKHLNELIENLNIAHLEDSVQKLSKLPSKELDKIIDELIAKVIEQEEKEKELREQQQMDNLLLQQNKVNSFSNQNNNAGGKWYFYNPMTVSNGMADFKRKWGNRKLEDNWRRKNKAIVMSEELANIDSVTGTNNKGNSKSNPKSREYYLQNIPFSDSAFIASNEKLYMAMFNVGRVYKDKLNDYPEAIKSFEKLIAKNDKTDYTITTYYYLYQLNMLENKKDRAAFYKNLLITKFPESQYTKMLTNPNFLEEQEAEKKKVNVFYEQTYVAYLQGNYRKVADNCKIADSLYSNHDLIPKFAFLKALTVGKVTDVSTFKLALKKVTTDFPDTPEKTAASEMLTYLENLKLDSLQNHLASLQFNKENTDSNRVVFEEFVDTSKTNIEIDPTLSQAERLLLEAEKIYKFSQSEQHYYVSIVDNKNLDVNRLRFNISSFNIEVFSFIDFDVSQPIILDGDVQMLTVKSFKDKTEAMAYFRHISVNPIAYGELKTNQYRHFVISATNYPLFYKDKNVEKYITFFTKNYLGE
ncbi:MAG: tetratricopeptide repeat protein [Bacteroidales bacterium]|nr:tetratricopeptide repeat protein [Bacteroidales bacterium]